MKMLKSLEELLYELVFWIMFFPVLMMPRRPAMPSS